MEKNMTLNIERTHATKSICKTICESQAVKKIAASFSTVLGEHITPEQALALINMFIALIMLVFPAGLGIVARILCLAWFCLALAHCKDKGLNIIE